MLVSFFWIKPKTFLKLFNILEKKTLNVHGLKLPRSLIKRNFQEIFLHIFHKSLCPIQNSKLYQGFFANPATYKFIYALKAHEHSRTSYEIAKQTEFYTRINKKNNFISQKKRDFCFLFVCCFASSVSLMNLFRTVCGVLAG